MDIERIARDLLRGRGFDCRFYAPDPMPGAFVTVRRTARPGSARFVGRAMLTVQAWATTRGAALALCEDAVDALVGRGACRQAGGLAAADDDILACLPENGPYRWDDPDTKGMCRWQATVSVDYNA